MSRELTIGTQEHTKVLAVDEPEFNANHEYVVESMKEPFGRVLTKISFQKGPTKEYGFNGIFNEDLLMILIDRLLCLNDSEFVCEENSNAITKLQEAQMWLRKRTEDRRNRGVLGRSLE